MVKKCLELDFYQNSAKKYLGFYIISVRKGNNRNCAKKLKDSELKWCEKEITEMVPKRI